MKVVVIGKNNTMPIKVEKYGGDRFELYQESIEGDDMEDWISMSRSDAEELLMTLDLLLSEDEEGE